MTTIKHKARSKGKYTLQQMKNKAPTAEGEHQRKVRIRVAVTAFARRYYNVHIMSDVEYTTLVSQIDTAIPTGHDAMDEYFTKTFGNSADTRRDTGLWVYSYPNKAALWKVYNAIVK